MVEDIKRLKKNVEAIKKVITGVKSRPPSPPPPPKKTEKA